MSAGGRRWPRQQRGVTLDAVEHRLGGAALMHLVAGQQKARRRPYRAGEQLDVRGPSGVAVLDRRHACDTPTADHGTPTAAPCAVLPISWSEALGIRGAWRPDEPSMSR